MTEKLKAAVSSMYERASVGFHLAVFARRVESSALLEQHAGFLQVEAGLLEVEPDQPAGVVGVGLPLLGRHRLLVVSKPAACLVLFSEAQAGAFLEGFHVLD